MLMRRKTSILSHREVLEYFQAYNREHRKMEDLRVEAVSLSFRTLQEMVYLGLKTHG
jgi:hypothetical protein